MSRYSGWDFEEMRTKRKLDGESAYSDPKRRRNGPCNAPTGSSFTPINGFSRSQTPLFDGAQAQHDSSQCPAQILDKSSTLSSQGAVTHRNALVADYLMLDHNVLEQSSRLEAILNPADGRTGCLDDPNVTASEPSKPLRAARKGKPKQTKPRNSSKRLSSASDGLPIVKPSVSTNAIKDVDQNSEVMPLKAQSAVDYESPEPFRLPETTARKLDKFRLDDDFRVEPVKGSTSSAFDHVQVVAPLTTIGSLKAQQGFGCTIYNGSPQTMSSLSFPLMPSSSMRSSPYEDADTNDAAEASIPRKRTRTGPDHILHVSTGTHDAQHACSVAQRRRSFAQSPHLDTIYETSEEGARSGVPPHELDICQQPQRSKASTYQSDDSAFDLSDGDLSDADLLNLLPSESTEPDETQSRNDIAPPQQRSTTTALPTPLQSDPLPSSPLQNACQTSLAGVLGDDDWIELDDDEELARLDLTETSCVRNEHSAQLSSGTAGSVRLVQKSFQLTNDSMEPANAEEHSFDCPIKPVVRPAPPKPIRDRSPIVGATPSTPLRVCFRVGEALNIGAKAVREGNDVILELYARLAASHRETNSVKQHFVFADLWAQRGPRLKGVYEVWKGSDIWDADSRAFLDAHETERLCRCIARMKKENHEWKLTVMNIWEADWDDIEQCIEDEDDLANQKGTAETARKERCDEISDAFTSQKIYNGEQNTMNLHLPQPPTASATPSNPTTLEAMLASQLSEQLRSKTSHSDNGRGNSQEEHSNGSLYAVRTPSKSPSKTRSLSDSTPKLSPSPHFKERIQTSKDDHAIPSSPKTPRRPDFLARGLSLQMPSKQDSPNTGVLPSRGPLSPKLDKRNIYSSPASVLPRHSRGLDFSRACTNLHHSTLAEQSSPDSSPTITQKGIAIPSRSSLSHSSMILDSPQMSIVTWSQPQSTDKSVISGSVSSINMLESSSSDSDEVDPMEPDENEDLMISTPQAYKLNDASAATPFAAAPMTRLWPGSGAGAPSSFMSFQRARLRHRRSRHSSSSASGQSSLASPIPQSPPNGRADANGYTAATVRKAASRRESLSLGTSDLHISSGNDSGDEAGQSGLSTPGVVQRPVTRRTNMLPKTRAFGRIKAELIEESSPVDTEIRREAQVVHQVRENDGEMDKPQQGGDSSPLLPAAPDGLDDIPEGNAIGADASSAPKGLFGAFSRQAFKNSISGGKEFWNNFDNSIRTPPPPFFPRASSSVISDDMLMDSPTTSSSTPSTTLFSTSGPQPQDQTKDNNGSMPLSRSSTPQPPPPPSAAEGIRKNNKRRRDDDLDGMSMKRRAVSPGMSVQNSPILSQSPSQRENLWGQPHSQSQAKISREGSVSGHAAGERSNSSGSQASVIPAFGPMGKRIGLQGMTDTNDGLMKMSIE